MDDCDFIEYTHNFLTEQNGYEMCEDGLYRKQGWQAEITERADTQRRIMFIEYKKVDGDDPVT